MRLVLNGQNFVDVPGLKEQQVAFFQAVFDHYKAHEKWPPFEKICRELVQDMDVEEVVQGLHWPWIDGSPGNNNPVQLRLPALLHCKGAEEILGAFLTALRLAVTKYCSKEEEPQLSQASLTKQGLSNVLAHHALVFLASEGLDSGRSGSVPGDWVMTFGSKIRKFRDVKTIDEYLDITAKEGMTAKPLGRRSVPAPAPPPNGQQSFVPKTAFIMMWLNPDNPEREEVATAIREAFAVYGIKAEHAMDVDHDGVITTLILDRIKDAEFLVADLTGERPSVYYEVGYAHALGKRTMLVRRAGTKIHFDLSVHNAPEYQDAADLKRLLLRRLDERIGPPPVFSLKPSVTMPV